MSGTFRYANPTTISWGVGSLERLGARLAELGASRILLVSTPPVAENGALMSLVADVLPTPPVGTALIGGHAPLEDVRSALALRLAVDADVVISLGGGGPIDAAKGVARGALEVGSRVGAASQDGTPAASGAERIPHIAVPTTLAAAELSWRAGFANDAGDKVGFADQAMLPVEVVYSPELAVHTPVALWSSTGIRAVDHAVEGFLSGGEHPFSDVMAVEAIARLIEALPRARRAPENVAARGDAQLGAWFSYTLPLASMTGLSHQMGKQIGARHGIGHGDTSALLLPHVMRYRAMRQPERAAALAAALDRRIADGRQLDAVTRVAELVAVLGLPRNLAAFGVGAEDVGRAAAEIATAEYPEDDIRGVYAAALTS